MKKLQHPLIANRFASPLAVLAVEALSKWMLSVIALTIMNLDQKLLIIKLILTESWGYNHETKVFHSDGWKLFVDIKQMAELEAVANQLDKIY